MTVATPKLVMALPSKGRLMDQCNAALAKAGLAVTRPRPARSYKGEIEGLPGAEVTFVSSSEIPMLLRNGAAHMGVVGEDLVREAMEDADQRVHFLQGLAFGHADLVVAVPGCWLDVRCVADLEEMSVAFRRLHGRRVRVATKYVSLTRRFFAHIGFTGYRIIESPGATEGAPAAGFAELIVDITTTGATLEANGLKVLDDGVILRSEATLLASRAARWAPELVALVGQLCTRLSQSRSGKSRHEPVAIGCHDFLKTRCSRGTFLGSGRIGQVVAAAF